VTTKLPARKRPRGDLAGLREGRRQGEYKVKRVPDGSVLADPVSKGDITPPTERSSLRKRQRMAVGHSNAFPKDVRTWHG
jgi:hypothetical protein